ncbi:LuxR family transcriptional regulator [Nonomuraea sp. KC401]|uniref:ATP-binding protein n=1 Tax=unclassified Nonomuraea TaxID=2593643 RepID=UPI0010FE3F1D|nr:MULTISPECIES: NB-ARC domain-containing protein [unclassified Nonomuraea]NBE98392.1 LuxR family transcriptional regulator [Nonomuraea sp. K271]TLF61116.1 LuxR family transcriptional regulator [Nonomuraea sp. KC401]
MKPNGGLLTGGSSFIGRRRELSTARKALTQGRLLTLTGPGGVGKTHLALRIVEHVRGMFRDGVAVVELGTLETGELLEPAVAAALGLHDTGPDPMNALVDYVSGKRMLLVLDNCEHLCVICGRFVDRLLRAAPRLRILVTSRQTLGVYGERVLPVRPLPVPDPGRPPGEIARHDSVRLLESRMAAVLPGFSLAADNAHRVARLAQRLEGVPLAIELAAARLRTMSLDQLLRELDRPIDVLAADTCAALPRHHSVRATTDWSYGLCSPGEQRLWARLSMFPAGVDLDTAESVCSGDGIDAADVLDLLAGLVDKSVVCCERRGSGLRYRMLESLRAYGGERLASSDKDLLRGRYVDHYGDLVRNSRIDRLVPDQLERYRRLQAELPNVRVALEACLSRPPLARAGLDIASTLWCFWLLAGSLIEGRYWLERGLGLVPEPGGIRATALWVDSMLALRQGDLMRALPRLEECLDLARRPGNEAVLPYAIRTAGVAAFSSGDHERGLSLLRESLALHRAGENLDGVMLNLYYAAAYGSVGHPGQAAEFGEELLDMSEKHHAQVSRAYAQLALGVVRWNLGDCRRAEALVTSAAVFTGAVDDRWCLTQCLEVLAWIAGARQDHWRAAGLMGAAHALWQAMGASPERLWYHAAGHERCREQARGALGGRAFATAFRQGTRLGQERAVNYAVAGP